MGLFESAVSALAGAERRTDIAARNVANAGTPGYKREVAFTEIAAAGASASERFGARPTTGSVRNAAQGVLTESGNPLDLAIDGAAFVLVRDGERLFPSRAGAFRLAADGRIVDAQGRSLQQAGGGDLTLGEGELVVHPDGTVLVDDVPMGAIGLYAAGAPAAFPDSGLAPAAIAQLDEAGTATLRQGMLEGSNVTLSDEMVGLMKTQRLAEAAAQLVRTYDQLVGQATATFNRGGK